MPPVRNASLAFVCDCQVSVPPDMTLFRTGDPANELYVVAGGAVDLHYERSGNEVLEAARTVGQARPIWHSSSTCAWCQQYRIRQQYEGPGGRAHRWTGAPILGWSVAVAAPGAINAAL